jgi:hypothetical protein
MMGGPGQLGRPGAYQSMFPGYGNWVPLDQIFDTRGGLKNPFDFVDSRTPFEVGIPGQQQEIANPAVTGVAVYKPNIYLYHPVNGTVNVKLLYESMITASDPTYPDGKGWTACLLDGTINGNGDYLFYEAIVPDVLFQKQTGWLVQGGQHTADMEGILCRYGFNDREKSDFLEFWCEKLESGNSYVFYPQETCVIDTVMPLETDISFSSRNRIWFYITPYADQKFTEPGHLDVIRQHENALVEWGGIYNDQ